MKPDLDKLLETLTDVICPGVSLDQVAHFTKIGRSKPRFYLSVWLSRIWKRAAS